MARAMRMEEPHICYIRQNFAHMRTEESENMVPILILGLPIHLFSHFFYLELIVLLSIEIWNKIACHRVVVKRDFPLSATIFVPNLVRGW
jgi:hypothetical protein